jgi:hypothetical protein
MSHQRGQQMSISANQGFTRDALSSALFSCGAAIELRGIGGGGMAPVAGIGRRASGRREL